LIASVLRWLSVVRAKAVHDAAKTSVGKARCSSISRTGNVGDAVAEEILCGHEFIEGPEPVGIWLVLGRPAARGLFEQAHNRLPCELWQRRQPGVRAIGVRAHSI
jgi:hypothetical protein